MWQCPFRRQKFTVVDSLCGQTDNAIGRIKRMDAIGARKISEDKLGDAKSRLVLLDHALAKIDTPDFGLCVSCGEPIVIARLKLMPESRFCVDCAS